MVAVLSKAIADMDIASLEQKVKEFPWCQLYHLELSKKYYQLQHDRFETQLNDTALRIYDREYLFDYIHIQDTPSSISAESSSSIEKEIPAASVVVEEAVVVEEVVASPVIINDEKDQEVLDETSEQQPEIPQQGEDIPAIVEEEIAAVVVEVAAPMEQPVSIEQTPVALEPASEVIVPSTETAESTSSIDMQSTYSFSDWLHILKHEPIREHHTVEEIPVISSSDEVQPEMKMVFAPIEEEEEAEIINDPEKDELDELIISNVPFDIFAYEKDLTENQLTQVNSFVENQIKRKEIKEPKNLEEAPIRKSDFYLPTDELVTETLALLYAKQGKKEKAIMAYKKLLLKFPEKSTYFASQIEKLIKK